MALDDPFLILLMEIAPVVIALFVITLVVVGAFVIPEKAKKEKKVMMRAYLNDPKLKQDFLAEIRKHQEADRIIQGTYGEDGEDFKGCAVGCSIRSLNIIKGKHIPTGSHEAYEPELDMPVALAHLEDRIFEGLPVEKAKQWPYRFADAVTVGADLTMVIPKFLVWLMDDLEQFATAKGKVALRRVSSLYERRIAGDEPGGDEWHEAATRAANTAVTIAAPTAVTIATTWAATAATTAAARAADAAC